jgi:hypothetical protein
VTSKIKITGFLTDFKLAIIKIIHCDDSGENKALKEEFAPC